MCLFALTLDNRSPYFLQHLGLIAKKWLRIADKKSIYDKSCLQLAKLHSDAVDYPKTGKPVPIRDIPKDYPGGLPDWSKPEIVKDGEDYYKSQKALGVLYRDIQLFDPKRRRRQRRMNGSFAHDAGEDTLVSRMSNSQQNMGDDEVYEGVMSRMRPFLSDEIPNGKQQLIDIADNLFDSFAARLEDICASYTMSNKQERLSEVEAILGVISERTSQPRGRNEQMARLREHTSQLVTDTLWELELGEQRDNRKRLALALAAWDLSKGKMASEQETFGARSFWWVSLGAVFDAMRAIEREEGIH